jgi:hypothetical protein
LALQRSEIEKRARLLAIGEDRQKFGQPHIAAMRGNQALYVVAPSPSARPAHDLDRRGADVG